MPESEIVVPVVAGEAADLSVAGQVVLITGGGAGLGQAAARILAARGARLGIVDVRPERVEETTAAIRQAGHEAIGVVADVAEPEQIQRAIDRVVAAFGRLDVMINNAAIIRTVRFFDVTPELWRTMMDVNATSVFFGTQLAARQMIAQAPDRRPGELIGRIVNVTSGGADGDTETTVVYGAGKAAVNRITRGAATALYVPHGICVSALRPVGMPTPMWDEIDQQEQEVNALEPGEARRRRAQGFVFGRFQSVEVHAQVLAWLIVAPPETVNGKVVTTVPTVGRL